MRTEDSDTVVATMTRGPKPRLTREQIIEAALLLLREVGVAGFNLRALAKSLHLSPMGLYRYFSEKEELLDAVIAHVLADVSVDGRSDWSWDQQLEEAVRGMFEALIANPGVAELCATRLPGEQLDPLRRRLTAITARAGFSPIVSEDALRALTSYVLGFALVASPRQHGARRTATASLEFGVALLMDSLRRMRVQ